MPFQSEAQRRFLWAKHPDIAKRWADEYSGQKDLPARKQCHECGIREMKKRERNGRPA